MKKSYAILNVISILLVVIWNGYVGAKGLNGNKVGELSNQYDSFFTPAGYAFTIWSVIFIGLLVLAVYLIKLNPSKDPSENEFMKNMGPWLILANTLNCIWLVVWLYEYTFVSVLIMLGILISLLTIIVKLQLNITEKNKLFNYCVAMPIAIYAGWITVATVANISAWLGSMEWSPILSETWWTVVMLLISALIYIYMVSTRKLFSYGAVGIWAILAILVRHYDGNSTIVIVSILSSLLILFAMILSIKNTHKNKKAASR